jgi:hypothetical protein
MPWKDKPGHLRTSGQNNTLLSLDLGLFFVICLGHWVTGQEGQNLLP